MSKFAPLLKACREPGGLLASRITAAAAIFGALITAFAACSSVPKRAGELATDAQREAIRSRLDKELGLAIEVDDPMPLAALVSITNGIFAVKNHRFGVVPPNHPFSRFFGSNSITAVYGFLRDRIHHFGVMNPMFDQALAGTSVYAMNTGATLWRLKDSDYRSAIRLGGNRVDAIQSSRYGLIELSPRTLINAKEFAELDAQRLAHFAAFVHEARHSDCTGGARHEQLVEIKNLPTTCTYPHVACKENAFVQGVSCDGNFWGAYSAGYSAYDGVLSSCLDCDKATLRMLKINALEQAGRINALPDDLSSRISDLLVRYLRGETALKLEPIADELLARTNSVLMSEQVERPDLSSAGIID